jgi:hypothetical protein
MRDYLYTFRLLYSDLITVWMLHWKEPSCDLNASRDLVRVRISAAKARVSQFYMKSKPKVMERKQSTDSGVESKINKGNKLTRTKIKYGEKKRSQ